MAGGPPHTGDPAIGCPQCDRVVDLETTLSIEGGMVWFTCPECGYRAELRRDDDAERIDDES